MSKKTYFKKLQDLEPVEKVVREAEAAINDSMRTIKDSSIPEAIGGAVGMGAGAAGSFAALYTLGTTGLSAAGITSGLAAAGSIVGGGMVAGVGVLAAPVAVTAVLGYGIMARRKHNKLMQEKESMLRKAIQSRDAIVRSLRSTNQDNKERLSYLEGLVNLLNKAVDNLQSDLKNN